MRWESHRIFYENICNINVQSQRFKVVESRTMENKQQKIKQTAYTVAIILFLILILYKFVVVRKKDDKHSFATAPDCY